MTEINPTERLEYLAQKFDVFETHQDKVSAKIENLKKAGYTVLPITVPVLNSNVPKFDFLALVYYKSIQNQSHIINVSVGFEVFSDMIAADPTPNKSCVQWMLNAFVRYLKSGEEGKVHAVRFVLEDLPLASTYITLFEANKRKVKFKKFCATSNFLKHVKDCTDINQYKSLSQLYDAVDPFIERKPTEMESLLQRYVSGGQAIIPVRDRKFTLYVPLTTDASVIFQDYAGWCTARIGNSMFKSYTETNLRPDGKNSKLYIILDNKFFTEESKDVYQIHFETHQIKDRHNGEAKNFYLNVIHESEALAAYFYDELMPLAKQFKKGINDNYYLDQLQAFGFGEALFELFDTNTPTIKIMSRDIPKLPDMTRFKKLDQLIVIDAKLMEVHPSIGNLKDLQMLTLSQNMIKTLPKEIGLLKNLMFLNLVGNPIQDFPEELANLDQSRGGKLFRLAIKKADIGDENYKKLRRLLPSVLI